MGKANLFIIAIIALVAFGFSTPSNSDISSERHVTSFTVNDTVTWKNLGDVKFTKGNHPDYGEVMFPKVNAKVKALHKKKITISGFVVPIDNEHYALSKNVFAACFFCGQAGPETIMGIHFKDFKGRIKTDTYVTITGYLRINENNVDDWIYNLDNTVVVKGL